MGIKKEIAKQKADMLKGFCMPKYLVIGEMALSDLIAEVHGEEVSRKLGNGVMGTDTEYMGLKIVPISSPKYKIEIVGELI